MLCCRTCGREKPLEAFYIRKNGSVQYPCRACKKAARRRAWRAKKATLKTLNVARQTKAHFALVDELTWMARMGGLPEQGGVPPAAWSRLAEWCEARLCETMGRARANALWLWIHHSHELRAAGKVPWFQNPEDYRVVRDPGRRQLSYVPKRRLTIARG